MRRACWVVEVGLPAEAKKGAELKWLPTGSVSFNKQIACAFTTEALENPEQPPLRVVEYGPVAVVRPGLPKFEPPTTH